MTSRNRQKVKHTFLKNDFDAAIYLSNVVVLRMFMRILMFSTIVLGLKPTGDFSFLTPGLSLINESHAVLGFSPSGDFLNRRIMIFSKV